MVEKISSSFRNKHFPLLLYFFIREPITEQLIKVVHGVGDGNGPGGDLKSVHY